MKNTNSRKETKTDASPVVEKPNSPVTTIWVDDVGASVWGRDVLVKGKPVTYFSVSLERSYRDRDGVRKYSRSFDADTLPRVIEACQQAHDWLFKVSKTPEA